MQASMIGFLPLLNDGQALLAKGTAARSLLAASWNMPASALGCSLNWPLPRLLEIAR